MSVIRPEEHQPHKFIYRSTVMREVDNLIHQIAAADCCVLISGESGTGKEVIASLLHARSPRAKKPYGKKNCAAIPEAHLESELFGIAKRAFTNVDEHEGLLKATDGGSLFLDEIAEMSLPIQAKMLNVLDGHPFSPVGSTKAVSVDVRFLCATHEDLWETCKARRFRQDLYYRIKGIEIKVPPLRERPEDILPLVVHFLRRYADRYAKPNLEISPQAMSLLHEYSWPGNVRELQKAIEQSIVLARGPSIQPEDLPEDIRPRRITTSRSQPPRQLPEPTPDLDRIPRRHLVDEVLARLRRDRVVALLTTYKGGGRTLARQIAAQYDGVPVVWLHNHATPACSAEEFFQILTRGDRELTRNGPIRSQIELYNALDQLVTDRGLLIGLIGTSSGSEELLEQVAATARSLHADRKASFLVVGGERLLRLCIPQIYSWSRLLPPQSFFDVPDLSESEVAELLRLCQLPESRAAMLHCATGGHPGFLQELIRGNIEAEDQATAEVMYHLSASHKLDRYLADAECCEVPLRLLKCEDVAPLSERYVRHDPTRYAESRLYFDGLLSRDENGKTGFRCPAIRMLFEKELRSRSSNLSSMFGGSLG